MGRSPVSSQIHQKLIKIWMKAISRQQLKTPGLQGDSSLKCGWREEGDTKRKRWRTSGQEPVPQGAGRKP